MHTNQDCASAYALTLRAAAPGNGYVQVGMSAQSTQR
jgi:hypothetical protein